ncbi:MAG: phage major capsid protein [Sphingomonas phyllosphaerae]|uniref:phage major capsid protein n=1 Tax=Sphingomonas phyllosphaerae TaxID=257003 RepID=UPI002FF46467
MTPAIRMPSSLLAVRASAPPKKYDSPEALGAAFEQFKAHYNGKVDRLQETIEAVNLSAALGNHHGTAPGIDRDYSNAFEAHMRVGDRAGEATGKLRDANAEGDRAAIQASMSSGDNSSGGFLAPVEWDRTVSKAQRDRSPMRRLAQVVQTTVGAYVSIWNDDAWGTGWVGETAARPQTTTPTLSVVTFGHGEIYANPAVTQRLLDDAQFDVETWLAGEVSDTFDRQEGVAFLSGDGNNKPFGMLQYVTGGAAATQHPGGTLTVVPSGAAATIASADTLIDFKYGLPAPYRQNASWLMNSQTAAAIAKMKDSTGAFLWREGLAEDQPSTLLGRPVEIDEGMPSIAAGNLAIAFGDFQAGYVINDRVGTRVLRDPYTAKPFVLFYTTKRVGGGVKDPRAIRLLKIAAS